MLFQHLRINQIYGANTDVGKTIFSTILALTNAAAGNRVFYLKPVSTGPARDADNSHVFRYSPEGHLISTKCLIQMDEPVSPHLAAQTARQVISDRGLLKKVNSYLLECSKDNRKSTGLGAIYVETAGGTLSPTPSGTTQADAYRPLRLPVVLVGDSKLGGISTTLAAYETLHTRGYDIHAVLMFKNDYYQNHTYLAQWFKERGVALAAFDPPPPQAPRSRNDQQDESNMKSYYAHTASTSDAKRVIATLDERHKERIRAFETLPRRAASTFWYPFSQHKHIKSTQDLTIIDSAHGDVFTTAKHQLNNPSLLSPTFDGSASWWTQGVGHGNHTLTAVAANAAGRYGHVIFPRAIHEPAIELAERMLRSQGEGWASRVFFSDNGSTGMEVALKMALRTTSMLYPPGEKPDLEVLGLAGSYHGDTIGAMDACEGGVYNSTVEWYKGRGAWLQTPTVGFEDGHLRLRIPWLKERPQLSIGDVYDVSKRREGMLAEKYREYIIAQIQELVTAGRRFGGLVLEPLVLGAGGMKFVDPLFQAILVDVVRNNSHLLLPPTARDATLPVIFDEVFSGLGRLGFSSSSSVLGVKPDIAVYAKLLTGGLVPLAVTLASQRIFDVFLGDEKASALLHGHSYTAYPLGCAVANASLSILEEALRSEAFDKARKDWSPALDTMAGSEPIDPSTPGSLWSRSFVNSLSRLPSINWAMSLGTVLAFELKDMDSGALSGYGSSAADRALAPLKESGYGAPPDALGMHLRTLGNVGYLITSLNSEKHLIRRLEGNLLHCLEAYSSHF